MEDVAANGETTIDARDCVVHRARRATGSGFVALVGPASGPGLVIRTATDPAGQAGIQREGVALAAVQALDLPDSLRGLLPRVVAAGRAGDVGYLVEVALPGVPIDPRALSADDRTGLLRAIVAAVRPLHDSTATTSRPAADDLETWVDRRIQLVRRLVRRGRGGPERLADARLVRLGSTLRAALRDRDVTTARIHGDLWTGNVLVDEGAHPPRVSGIVDWDSSADRELPLQDLLHVTLYTRKLVERTSLGATVAAALGPDAALDRGAWIDDVALGTLTRREAVLLYWLRQVEMNVSRNPRGASGRRWRQRNVDPVVACL
jgi:aminoglycoside phosphotransferase